MRAYCPNCHHFRDLQPGSRENPPLGALTPAMLEDLDTVKNLYFRLEGFDSPEAFEKTWRALHRGHFTTGRLYYMHVFGRIA